jgi:hypothetical protein
MKIAIYHKQLLSNYKNSYKKEKKKKNDFEFISKYTISKQYDFDRKSSCWCLPIFL